MPNINQVNLNDDKDDILAREIIQENIGEKDPDIGLIDDFLDEIDIRMDQIKIFFPLMELLRKRKLDREYVKLIPEVSFLLLSYLIYEGKLKHKGITFENLESFMIKAFRRMELADVPDSSVKELVLELLDGLQNGGRNFTQSIYSFKSSGFKEKYIKFIEIKQSENGMLQYFITEQGVDFYLKTKEFPEETKITINLLLFQKQMEKGAFGFAYETVRRLNMEVQKKKDKKYTLLEALMYGQIDSEDEYKNYHRSIVQQFQEEAELFNVAVNNVQQAFSEYIERINAGNATDKEIRTFALIKIIEKEVGKAQSLHTELLKEAVSFTKEYDNVLSMRRKAIFTEKFSFEREFEQMVSGNGNPELIKYIFEPLISPNVKKCFNPLRVLEPQSISRNKKTDNEAAEGKIDSSRITIDDITKDRVKKNFIFYALELLEVLSEQKELDLQLFCKLLTEKYSEDMVYNGDFISFIIELNRNKAVGGHKRIIAFTNVIQMPDEDLKTIEEVFYKALLMSKAQVKISRIIVESFPDEDIELLPGLKITNISFVGEENI